MSKLFSGDKIGLYVGLELNVNSDRKVIEKVVKKDNNLCDVYFVDPYKPRNRKEKRDIKFKR